MTVFNPLSAPDDTLPLIMAVVTGGNPSDTAASVFSQDGDFITTRVAHNEERLRNEIINIAAGSDLYARYTALYPGGWRAEFVEPNNPLLQEALRLRREKDRATFGLDTGERPSWG